MMWDCWEREKTGVGINLLHSANRNEGINRHVPKSRTSGGKKRKVNTVGNFQNVYRWRTASRPNEGGK